MFEYGKQRAAVVGEENVFDFSLGNPSVPAPAAVNENAIRILREDGEAIHCYTSAQGDALARRRFADSLNRRYGTQYTENEFYVTVGAAAALCCVFGALTCPGDEFIAFAPYFPEYKVFVEGAGAKLTVVPPEIEQFQIDFDAFGAPGERAHQGRHHQQPQQPHRRGVFPGDPGAPFRHPDGEERPIWPSHLPHLRRALPGDRVPRHGGALGAADLPGHRRVLFFFQVPVPAR